MSTLDELNAYGLGEATISFDKKKLARFKKAYRECKDAVERFIAEKCLACPVRLQCLTNEIKRYCPVREYRKKKKK